MRHVQHTLVLRMASAKVYCQARGKDVLQTAKVWHSCRYTDCKITLTHKHTQIHSTPLVLHQGLVCLTCKDAVTAVCQRLQHHTQRHLTFQAQGVYRRASTSGMRRTLFQTWLKFWRQARHVAAMQLDAKNFLVYLFQQGFRNNQDSTCQEKATHSHCADAQRWLGVEPSSCGVNHNILHIVLNATC